jgi:hypothetical protein
VVRGSQEEKPAPSLVPTPFMSPGDSCPPPPSLSSESLSFEALGTAGAKTLGQVELAVLEVARLVWQEQGRGLGWEVGRPPRSGGPQ